MTEFDLIKKRFEFAKTEVEFETKLFKEMEYLIKSLTDLKLMIENNINESYISQLSKLFDKIRGI